MGCKYKNLTTEVAEHAEVRMAKGSRPRVQRENGSISNTSRKDKTAKGLSEKDLCALCFLFVLPLVFIRGGSRERKSLIPQWGKKPQTAEIREDAERMKYANNDFCF
jgi:hypothetical protein